MQTIKVIRRDVVMRSTPMELENEFRAARWVYNRLLDFELQHQERLDACSPRLARVGRLTALLNRREKRAERAPNGSWRPAARANLRASLETLRTELRRERNASEEWAAAKRWPLEKVEPKKCRRKSGESDADFQRRQESAGRSRREVHAIQVYAERRCHWGTYNAMKASVDQAVKSVVKARADGMPADLRRLTWRDRGRIVSQASQSGFELVDYGRKTIRCRMRMHNGWIDIETSGRGKLPELPEDYDIREVELIRDPCGASFRYHLCITVRGSWTSSVDHGSGTVGIDTGHRWLGDEGIRAFVWSGSDGQEGEVRLPPECNGSVELSNKIQETADRKFNSLGVPDRNRHAYRRRLERGGVRTQAQDDWLSWERRQERRMDALCRRSRNLRTEVYTSAARSLRSRYSSMAIDTVGKSVQKLQKDEAALRSTRRHRDQVAAYLFKSTCERFGVRDLAVPARNSSRECPHCGHLHEVTKDLMVRCPDTGAEYDQDFAAARTMLRRAKEALAEQAGSEQNERRSA